MMGAGEDAGGDGVAETLEAARARTIASRGWAASFSRRWDVAAKIEDFEIGAEPF